MESIHKLWARPVVFNLADDQMRTLCINARSNFSFGRGDSGLKVNCKISISLKYQPAGANSTLLVTFERSTDDNRQPIEILHFGAVKVQRTGMKAKRSSGRLLKDYKIARRSRTSITKNAREAESRREKFKRRWKLELAGTCSFLDRA